MFPFSTRNLPILHPKFSDDPLLVIYRQKLLSIQAILERNFHPKFSDDFLVIIYQTKISLHPIFWENVLVSGIFIHSYCFSRKGPRKSRYAVIYFIILQY